jgi:divalent metal cation (Fe/Co/Zn/Cd) transporter
MNQMNEKEEEIKDARMRRLRTEKHIAMLAKKNPELLDEKAKEIITRIDHTKLKRNNQLQSLDFHSKSHIIDYF